jgi:hypothetical protein
LIVFLCRTVAFVVVTCLYKLRTNLMTIPTSTMRILQTIVTFKPSKCQEHFYPVPCAIVGAYEKFPLDYNPAVYFDEYIILPNIIGRPSLPIGNLKPYITGKEKIDSLRRYLFQYRITSDPLVSQKVRSTVLSAIPTLSLMPTRHRIGKAISLIKGRGLSQSNLKLKTILAITKRILLVNFPSSIIPVTTIFRNQAFLLITSFQFSSMLFKSADK